MSEFPDLPATPAEPVPREVRVLAAVQNLGTLRSVHQPTSWFTRIQFQNGRIYLFDQGFVLGQATRGLRLFRRGRYTARKGRGGYLVVGPDGRGMGLNRKWSDFTELEKAITDGSVEGHKLGQAT